jgi:cell division septal protein FtsQ
MNDKKERIFSLKRLKFSNIPIPNLLLILAFVLMLLVVLFYLSNNWSQEHIITEIRISGNKFVETKDLYSLIKKNVFGKLKKDINLDTLNKLILTNPYIRIAEPNYGLRGELNIKVTERIPVAYLLRIDGKVMLVDDFGFVFPLKGLPKDTDLPVISNYNINTNLKCIKSCALFIENLKKVNPDYDSYILEYKLTGDYRVIKATSQDYKFELLMSTESDPVLQIEKYTDFLKNLNKADRRKNIDYVDLRWNNRVVIGYKEI